MPELPDVESFKKYFDKNAVGKKIEAVEVLENRMVNGETAHIGKHVKVYQGVTLGALSVSKSMAQTKRHPTIEDHVVIYSGATILGGDTVIGHHSIVGGNVWLTNSIPPHSRVYHRPQIEVSNKG